MRYGALAWLVGFNHGDEGSGTGGAGILLVIFLGLLFLLLGLCLLLARSSSLTRTFASSLGSLSGLLRLLGFLGSLGSVKELLTSVLEPPGILDIVFLLQLCLFLLVLLPRCLVDLFPHLSTTFGDLRDSTVPELLLSCGSAFLRHPQEVSRHGPLGHSLDL